MATGELGINRYREVLNQLKIDDNYENGTANLSSSIKLLLFSMGLVDMKDFKKS